MTVELSMEDLVEVQAAATKFGGCVFKTQTTDGEPVWLTVQGQRQRRTRRANGPQEAEAEAPGQSQQHG